jgi:NADPH:quinone reductase-like Zn-dependent oxidoreductase
MRAAVIDGYGGRERLSVREVDAPPVREGEVLIRVRAAGVNPIDWKLRQGMLRWLKPARFPLILGFDVAGEVEAVGPEVASVAPGDTVFAMLPGAHGGGYAELAVAPESAVALLPEGLSFEEAAALPVAGLTALQALRDRAELAAGESALILGGAGGVGHLAVQIAKAFGAHVSATASTRNLPLLWQLGADRAIDYTRTDWTTEEGTFAAIFDAVGLSDFAESEPLLDEDGGIYVTTRVGPAPFLASLRTAVSSLWGEKRRARSVIGHASGADLEILARMVARGQLRPLVESVFPLAEVARAHEASESGHTRGKIVLRID